MDDYISIESKDWIGESQDGWSQYNRSATPDLNSER